MALFTSDNAAIMGRKGAIARWTEPEPAVIDPPKAEPVTELNPTQAELSRTREHIDLINQQLDSCEDPDTWDALTRSKERLFRIWARLAQLPSDPKPVQLKQPKPTQALPEPTMLPAPANPGRDQGKP